MPGVELTERASVGLAVGSIEGESVVGPAVGLDVAASVGPAVGLIEGESVGVSVALIVGEEVGPAVGLIGLKERVLARRLGWM